MDKITIRFKKLDPKAKLPARAKPGDACLDIYTTESWLLTRGARHAFKTGVASEIPAGWWAQLCDRSGKAKDDGLTVIGGVIDETYRGEWHVILLNTSDHPVEIAAGDRVCQVAFHDRPEVVVEEATELSQSVRAANGFGSTGK